MCDWLSDSVIEWLSDKVTYWAVCGQLKRTQFCPSARLSPTGRAVSWRRRSGGHAGIEDTQPPQNLIWFGRLTIFSFSQYKAQPGKMSAGNQVDLGLFLSLDSWESVTSVTICVPQFLLNSCLFGKSFSWWQRRRAASSPARRWQSRRWSSSAQRYPGENMFFLCKSGSKKTEYLCN